jgi:hypothetical protein
MWIYVPHFMAQVRKYHKTKMDEVHPDHREPFSDEPHETSVHFAFFRTNPYRGKVGFTGRLNIARTIQKRLAHIDHESTHILMIFI